MSVPSRSHLGPICDTHLHIFGDRAKYPLVAGELRSEPPDAPLERFLKAAEAEGVTRMVFDQPSHYGLDNSCILDAIGTVGLSRARAIAAVDADSVTDAQLKLAEATGQDWVSDIARAQANFIRNISDAYISNTRQMLKS